MSKKKDFSSPTMAFSIGLLCAAIGGTYFITKGLDELQAISDWLQIVVMVVSLIAGFGAVWLKFSDSRSDDK